ncbi:MAG: mandelate racemase/muconate lactonizing enzyme family protein [Bryobacteraceae bacterium]|nr:mandelate racemase/muconate lactonizing enzyme family protein [Bryobacteraceae bacterium]
MEMRRRDLIFFPAAGVAARAMAAEADYPRSVPAYEEPLFQLHTQFKAPVKIAAVEYLRNGKNTFVRVVSADGVKGVVRTKDVDDFVPILLRRVAPAFVGRDARDLERIVDDVYIKHYKLAGQPFWSPVAAVEHAVWDLLGRTANKPVASLLGGIVRRQIPVYLSGSGRETTAEQEVDVYVRGIAETGAKAVKFKIGGRMSRNADAYPGRTKTMVHLARKLMGADVVLYADANGSYDSRVGIEVGKMLQDLGFRFFEEPCPWEEVSETRRVAQALQLSVAGGEQDSSLWKFQDMIERRVIDIVQPDLNYCGGIIRACRVARMARKANMTVVPHNTQTDAAACKMIQFAAATPNIGPHMEFPHRGGETYAAWYTPHFKIRNGKVDLPEGPGMGVEFDESFLHKAERVTA